MEGASEAREVSAAKSDLHFFNSHLEKGDHPKWCIHKYLVYILNIPFYLNDIYIYTVYQSP